MRYIFVMVPNPDYEGARSLLDKNRDYKKNREDFRFADFGTRRRHSFRWHDEVIQRLKENLLQAIL